MSRQLAVMMALVAATSFAEAAPPCAGGGRADTSAACRQVQPAASPYARVHPRVAPAVRSQWYRDEDEAWTVLTQNAFLNQCLILDYRVRATERAMYETEYWSRADRYREVVQALRAEQYYLGCFG